MSLTSGNAPFGFHRAGRAEPALAEGGIVYVEPHPRRIHAMLDGEVVIDTEHALMVHRPGSSLAYAFPSDVVGDLPTSPEPMAPGFVQVPWDAVDTWFEEGRRLVHYPPNPYHRVDCRPTHRRLRVSAGGVTVVDTDDTTILFETSLEPRLYVDPNHVRTDLLQCSDTTTWCNYKGTATYWSLSIEGGPAIDDIAWSYDDPLPESTPIGRFLSFDPAKVRVDAQLPPPLDAWKVP